jgi:serine phosphatase RsbU (regulator of sigma subunit)
MEDLTEENRRLREQLDAKSKVAARALATYQQRVLQMEEHAAELAAANEENRRINDELSRALRVLEDKDRRLSEDLEQARSFQQRILPRLPAPPSLRFSAAYKPAEKVGGDVYDVAEVRPGTFRMFVADATGHGIQAALRTMILKSEYDRLKDAHDSPEQVLVELNRKIVAVYPGLELHCSAACFDVVPEAGGARLRYATAAHPPLLVASASEIRPIYEPGPFLGVVDHIELTPVEVLLSPGDRAFAYTDGLGEQWNQEGVEFGADRVHRALLRPARALDDVIRDLMTEIDAFLGEVPLADDAMVLGVEYLG